MAVIEIKIGGILMKKIKTLISLSLLISMMVVFTGCSTKTQTEETKVAEPTVELTISAAASLKDAMAELETQFKNTHPEIKLTFNFGSSGSLQQQIEQGAPCDVFISAGKSQMDALNTKGLILEDTTKNLVQNSLVLVGPKNTTITSLDDLKTDKVKKIALGEPKSVPAGKYADEVLTKTNMKDAVTSKLIFAKDVTEVLTWTQSENADVGFAYLSDSKGNDSIKIIETISEDLHSKILYPIGIIKASKESTSAKAFEDFLFTDEAQNTLVKYGYVQIK